MKLNIEESVAPNKFIHRIGGLKEELRDLRKNGLKKGKPTGFANLYDHYSVKEGSTTYVIAAPAVGKTSLLYEMLINLAEFEGWKIAIFSPEGGSPKDLFAELLWAYLRKPFLKHDIPNRPNASESEVESAYDFMEEHFYIIDAGLNELNADSYYRAIKDIELEDNVKINACVIDPVVELNINPENKREDVALGSFLTRVRKFSSEHNIHTFVAVHTKAMQLSQIKSDTGEIVYYYPQPTFFDTMGGQMWGRKGYMIMSLWRPPHQLINPQTDENYAKNETVIEILKVKPKAMGKIGKVSLFYDYWSSRYYEICDNNQRQFSRKITGIEDKEEKQEVINF